MSCPLGVFEKLSNGSPGPKLMMAAGPLKLHAKAIIPLFSSQIHFTTA
jgi:hypothetical protein